MSRTTIIKWTDGSETETSLKSIYEGFTSLYNRQKDDLKEVIAGEEVKTVGVYAFKACRNLERVHLPDSVEGVMEFAFSWCEKLHDVRLPEGIDRIAIQAFVNCSSLKGVKLPDSISLIDDEAFKDCIGLEEILIPESVKTVSANAFTNCRNLKEIRIPAGVEIIDAMAFQGCSELGRLSFDGGSSLKEIGPNAFEKCGKLNIEGGVFSKLATIGGHAFDGCKNLEVFELPESLGFIGDAAFRGCSSLKNFIKFNDKLRKIGKAAFSDCSSLTEAEFSSYDENIVPEALFSGCTSLIKVSGIENMERIEARAFLGCTALKTVSVSSKLKDIGEWAFKGCISLSLELPEGDFRVGTDAFSYISNIDSKGNKDFSKYRETVFTTQYYSDSDMSVAERMKLSAADILCCLRYDKLHNFIPYEIADRCIAELEEYRLSDNKMLPAELISYFDSVYDSIEFPLSEAGEIIRGKLYKFCMERLN